MRGFGICMYCDVFLSHQFALIYTWIFKFSLTEQYPLAFSVVVSDIKGAYDNPILTVVSELHRTRVVDLIESDRNMFMSFIARADNKTMQNSDKMAGQWVNATWNAKEKSQN